MLEGFSAQEGKGYTIKGGTLKAKEVIATYCDACGEQVQRCICHLIFERE